MAAARVQTARFMLKWRDVERDPGLLRLERAGQVDRRPCLEGIRAVPFVWGSPQWVGNGTPGQPPLDTSGRQAGVAELPQGGGGALRARRHLLGQQVQAGLPGRRHGRADPVLADLERAQSEEVLRARVQPSRRRPKSTLSCLRSPTTRSRPGIRRPRSCSPECPASRTGTSNGLGLPRHPLRGGRGQGRLRRRRPAPLRLQPGSDSHRDRQVQRRDEEPRRRATPLWLTEFAWGSGAPDQFCKNKGLTGQRDLLVSSFKLILQNRKNWNVQRLFWFLWRDRGAGVRATRGYCSICGSAGLLALQPHPEARLHRRSGLHGRDHPAGGADHLGAKPREASSTTRPRTSPSPRTRPARPSPAASTRPPSSPAPRR